MTLAEVAQQLYAALIHEEDLTNLVSDRIYPYATPGEVPTPWVVYDNINVEFTATKDSSTIGSATLTLTVCGKTYAESVTVSDEVLNAINNVDGFRAVSVNSFYDINQGVIHELQIRKDYE